VDYPVGGKGLNVSEAMMDFVNEGRTAVNQTGVELNETRAGVQAADGLVCIKDAAY
jgi:hypothetical protein